MRLPLFLGHTPSVQRCRNQSKGPELPPDSAPPTQEAAGARLLHSELHTQTKPLLATYKRNTKRFLFTHLEAGSYKLHSILSLAFSPTRWRCQRNSITLSQRFEKEAPTAGTFSWPTKDNPRQPLRKSSPVLFFFCLFIDTLFQSASR